MGYVKSPSYLNAGHEQNNAIERDLQEGAQAEKRTPEQQEVHIQEIRDKMSRHERSYNALFLQWIEDEGQSTSEGNLSTSADGGWISRLDEVVSRIQDSGTLLEHPKQPNPWADGPEKIEVTSKRYLTRLLDVLNNTDVYKKLLTDPCLVMSRGLREVIRKLEGSTVSDTLDGTVVEYEPSPIKNLTRVAEKALSLGSYDQIRDYLRGYFRVKAGHYNRIPRVLELLHASKLFDVVRIKNRFSLGYEAARSAGYRDVQVILKMKSGGWLYELQIVPEEMLDLKEKLGHQDYSEFRFILEAGERFIRASQDGSAKSVKDLVAKSQGYANIRAAYVAHYDQDDGVNL